MLNERNIWKSSTDYGAAIFSLIYTMNGLVVAKWATSDDLSLRQRPVWRVKRRQIGKRPFISTESERLPTTSVYVSDGDQLAMSSDGKSTSSHFLHKEWATSDDLCLCEWQQPIWSVEQRQIKKRPYREWATSNDLSLHEWRQQVGRVERQQIDNRPFISTESEQLPATSVHVSNIDRWRLGRCGSYRR